MQTQNNFIYGELGRYPLRINRLYHVIRYWLKIVESSECKYIKIVYNMMLKDMESNQNIVNWASKVKHILDIYGFSNVWLLQGVGNKDTFLTVFKQRT